MRLHPESPPTGLLSKPAHWSPALLAFPAAVVAAFLTSGISQAETLAGWNLNGLASYGVSPFDATTTAANVTVGGLTRGSGLTTANTAGTNAWGGNGWDPASTTVAAAVSANDFATFSVTASAGNQVSFTTIEPFNVRRSASGPALGQFQYQIGGGTFADIGTPITWGTVTSAAGNPQTAITLSSITALQGVPPGTTVTFRIVNYSLSGAGATGNWYLNEPSTSAGAGADFSVTGTVSPSATDNIPPTLSSVDPLTASTNVPISSNLIATFNEPVQAVPASTGKITIKTSAGVEVAAIPVGDPQISFSNGAVIINPTEDLLKNNSYYVLIDPATIEDLAGNDYAGLTSTSAWTFTTDNSNPVVFSLTPANGATEIAPTATLKITFNEPIQYASVAAKFVTVRNSNGTVFDQLESNVFDGISISGSVATIALDTALAYGASYYVEIDAGAFEDISGNPFAGFTGNTTWAFSTVDAPALTGVPYTQNFSTYTNGTLPAGWSFSGASNLVSDYRGDWGSLTADPNNAAATLGGFKGNASVFGYHHNSATNTSTVPLLQTLTLRNSTGAPITNLTVAYKGRAAVPTNTRIPSYTVIVADSAATALGYSTADGDNAQRNASVTGLNIAEGATFQIHWSSIYPAGAGSARQIGISDVLVSSTVEPAVFAPTVAGMMVPVANVGASIATAQADVIGDGGQSLSARGFVYSQTSLNSSPQLGGSGVSSTTELSPPSGAFSSVLSGLTPGINYTVGAYATNPSGTSYSGYVTFTTLGTPPTLISSYNQEFDAYNGSNPAGWTAVSDAVPPVQGYVGTWGTGSSSGGFLGGVSGPGVLGYRHTGSTGNLTVTLRLFNGSGTTLNSLYLSYLGRVKISATTPEGRSPNWAVSVNGSAPVAALAYDTGVGADATLAATVAGLSIAPGGEITVTWTSDRGAGSGSSKQIGIGRVVVATSAPVGYSGWNVANANGQGPTLDFDGDGVKNGVEYFFGATGSSFTANPQPNAAGLISFPHPGATPGATFKVFTSPDLSNWTNVTASTVEEGGFIKYTIPPGQGTIFARLEVVIAP